MKKNHREINVQLNIMAGIKEQTFMQTITGCGKLAQNM